MLVCLVLDFNVWMVLPKWSWRFSAVAIWSVDYSCPRVWANFSPSRPGSGSYARQTFHASNPPLSPQAPPASLAPLPNHQIHKKNTNFLPSSWDLISVAKIFRKSKMEGTSVLSRPAIHRGKWACISPNVWHSFSCQLHNFRCQCLSSMRKRKVKKRQGGDNKCLRLIKSMHR